MKKLKKDLNTKSASSDDEKDDNLGEYEAINSDGNESDELLDGLNEQSEESSEEEVLAIHSESDSEEEDEDDEDDDLKVSDSDIDQLEDDLPNAKGWGKKAKYYYDTNRIDSRMKFTNDEEEELAKMEELEAMTIQQRLLSELDGVDLSADLLNKVVATKQAEKEKSLKEDDRIVLDFSKMEESEKRKVLKKNSPELFKYIDDYKRLMTCVNNDLLPILNKLKEKNLDKSNAAEFAKIFYQLIMNYCVNITFYLMLKARKINTKEHPVFHWISKYEEMLKEAEPIFNTIIKSQIETILKSEPKRNAVKRKTSSKNSDIKQKSLKLDVASKTPIANELAPQLYQELSESDNDEKEVKRPITYQIAKNKGLTPHRKKELRNPRVKHRMKYRKAKIRRKGQVREVRKEVQKYGGEISGIKVGVVKSVKFKV